MSSEDLLTVTSLSKDFGSRRVVENVSFTASAGSIIGILGPNGAGKSTTMKLCAGALAPTEGNVTVCGADPVVDVVGARAHLGYVPDIGGLFPRLTGWEHLELAARLRDLPSGWAQDASALLGLLGLGDVAGQRTSTYSHGMGRKLSLAIALIGQPKVLLLDEPFDGVDPTGNRVIRTLIAKAADAGSAVVLCTHLVDVAESLCERFHVIGAGTVLHQGTAEEIREAAGTDTLEDAYLALLGLQ